MTFRHSFPCLALLVMVACGDDAPPSGDAGADAIDAGTDADTRVVTGERGAILGVEETNNVVIPELSSEVSVIRTEADVPHVYAENDRDLYIVQGFVVARDRYFEFELGRRLGQGRVSELLGDAGLSLDQLSRGQGFTQVTDRIFASLTDEQRAMFDAFAIGVNAYIEAVRNRVVFPPSELRLAALLFGFPDATSLMEPVTGQDVAAFMTVPVFQLGFDTNDVLRASIRARLAEAFVGEPDGDLRRAGLVDDIFERVEPTHAVSSAPGFGLTGDFEGISDARLPPARRARRARPGEVPQMEAEVLSRLNKRHDWVEQLLHGGRGADFGSNVWAVRPEHTTDGSTLLAGDGHLSLGVPTLFFQMGLDTRVFGDGDLSVLGLFFPGVPVMAVGTNGRVAWSQTYQRADVTDWYAEEIELDAAGFPARTRFRGDARDLLEVDETYVIADVPALESVGREETWTRYTTFDGRLLSSIEGRAVLAADLPGETGAVVNMQGDYVVPGDMNGDGVISGVSFDFTGLDLSNVLLSLEGFSRSDDVREFREHTRRLVAYSQNLGVADVHGNVLYAGYNAIPCRTHLGRSPDGTWAPGADPRSLLDGTEYGGFEIPLTDAGMPDETQGESAPERCLVPFDRFPASLNPSTGFIFNANNDIAQLSFDGSLDNDEFYLGGPWVPGQRAQTITTELSRIAGENTASIDSMAELQGNHESRVGENLTSFVLAAVAEARRLSEEDGPLTPDETRLRDLYVSAQTRLDEAAMRLEGWRARGYRAESGVETFYHSPTDADRDDAVATMLFNRWFREFFRAVFADEDAEYMWSVDPRVLRIGGLLRLVNGRGPDNPGNLASYDSVTEESILFDDRGTAERERADELAVLALARTLVGLAEPASEPGVGGFGTPDMSEWLWGLRHQVKFESLLAAFAGQNPAIALLADGFAIDTGRLPLAEDLADTDPRADLSWFPRPGDLNAVDAANWSFTREDYTHENGPVMRMVISLSEEGVSGQNILPQGQNGRPESEHFDDQAALWLGNETIPMRFSVTDVVAGAVGRERFSPSE